MKVVFIKDTLHSFKKDKDFYCIRYALVDEKNNVLAKSEPLLWLTKEQYDNFNI